MDSLDSILQELPKVGREGKINAYALRYAHRSRSNNFSVSLPSNQNQYFLQKFCSSLNVYQDFTCTKYDPIGRKENTYEFLPAIQVSTVWKDMTALINSSQPLKHSPYQSELPGANLTICELEYDNKKYWIGTQQQKSGSIFKDKYPFLSEEGKLKAVDVKRMLTLGFHVDFVVSDENDPAVVYVFNRKSFEKVFNYYELLKSHVKNKSDVILDWKFLDNPAFIQKKIDTGYVFKGLARIIDNTEYLKEIKQTKPHTLKKRLIQKCDGIFSEKDFDGDKLTVTKSNLENVIKMLSKEFRYNFFSDKAEEW